MLLTKHENETFQNQTVYISGQAFIRCKFIACTLVLRDAIYHWEDSVADRCNWHIDWILLWGSRESLRHIKDLVTLLEKVQLEQLPPDEEVRKSGAADADADDE